MKAIYQWILRDKQELSFQRFIFTEEYFADEDAVRLYFPLVNECFSIVGRYEPSKIKDTHLIEIVTRIQNERKSSSSKDK